MKKTFCIEVDVKECEPCKPAVVDPAAVKALQELEFVSNLSLPDASTVTLQVGYLRPRLALIRKALVV